MPDAAAAAAPHAEPAADARCTPLRRYRRGCPLWPGCTIAFAALSLLAAAAPPMAISAKCGPPWSATAFTIGCRHGRRLFEFTDDERQMRDLAYPLIEPPYDRQQWYSVAGEYGVTGSIKRDIRSEYANCLLSSAFRSPSARYSQLIDDARNDVTRLPQFFETATRVIDIDRKRRKSLAFVSSVSPKERDDAFRRIADHAALVSKVSEKLGQRVAAYRIALERLVIMTPSQQAIEAERSINQLQTQLAYYQTHSAPTWAREQSLASAR